MTCAEAPGVQPHSPTFRSVAVHRIALYALALAVVSTPAAAQSDSTAAAAVPPDSVTAVVPDRWHLGGTFAVPVIPGVDGLSLTGLGFIATAATKPNRLSPDLAIVVAPRALQAGVVFANIRLNVAVPLAAGASSRLIPSAGLSLLGAVGYGGAGGMRAVNATVAYHAFARANGNATTRLGARFALGRHQFTGIEGGGFWLFEVGLVRR